MHPLVGELLFSCGEACTEIDVCSLHTLGASTADKSELLLPAWDNMFLPNMSVLQLVFQIWILKVARMAAEHCSSCMRQ